MKLCSLPQRYQHFKRTYLTADYKVSPDHYLNINHYKNLKSHRMDMYIRSSVNTILKNGIFQFNYTDFTLAKCENGAC